MTRRSNERLTGVLLMGFVFLLVIVLNSACSCVSGLCKDIGSASDAIARAAIAKE